MISQWKWQLLHTAASVHRHNWRHTRRLMHPTSKGITTPALGTLPDLPLWISSLGSSPVRVCILSCSVLSDSSATPWTVAGASLVAQLVKNLQQCRDPHLIPGLGRSPEGGKDYPSKYSWASLVAHMVKNPPIMWETWVWFLGREDPLEEGMATHSSILAWRIPMYRGAWWATVHGITKSQTRLRD